MRGYVVSSALLVCSWLAGCQPGIREGHFACSADSECPSGWSCVAARCYSSAFDAAVDSSVDSGRDGGPDSSVDSGLDGGGDSSIDSSVDSGMDGGGVTTDQLDLLVMVDNSNSMTEEQLSLAAAFPELVRALSLGDTDGDGRADVTPVSDMHVGVISSDMGTGGYPEPTCTLSDYGDDGVLRTDAAGSCVSGDPPFLSFDGLGISAFRTDFACAATLGTGGCGFEQQLEAPLKALTPSTSSLRFFNDSSGHGDVENAGFMRPDAILVVLVVTDEEDCSASVPELFRMDGGPYGAVDLNLRCTHDWASDGIADPLHPIARYADGFRALKPGHPERVVFAGLVGVPVDIESAPFATILADPRMENRVDATGTRNVPSCDVPMRGVAYPPRRIVETARELQLTGSTGLVRSICQADYSGFVDALLGELQPLLTPR